MIVFWLFMKYFVAFIAAVLFYLWLTGWLGSVTTTEAVLTFMAVFAAVAAVSFLVVKRRGGFVLAVALAVFWSLVIFGAAGRTAVGILILAGAALFVVLAVTIAEAFVVRR